MKIRDEGVVSDAAPATSKRIRTRLLGYLALTKPRVVELLLVTTIPAMLLKLTGSCIVFRHGIRTKNSTSPASHWGVMPCCAGSGKALDRHSS